MTIEEASQYINEVLTTGQMDVTKLTEALNVVGKELEQKPEDATLTGLFNLGMQVAASQGYQPAFVGEDLVLVTGAPTPTAPTTTIPGQETGTGAPTPPTTSSQAGAAAPPAPVGIEDFAQGQGGGVVEPQRMTPQGSAGQQPPTIGVPEDYIARQVGRQMGSNYVPPSGGMGNAPLYRDGDQQIPATYDPIEIRRLQRDLERAGLLPPNSYVPGFWDAASKESYLQALGYANQSGDPVQTVLAHLATIPKAQTEEAQELTADQIRQFVPSDPATLAQTVKREFRQQLGREPTPEEVRVMAAELGGFEGTAFDQETARIKGVEAAINEAMGITNEDDFDVENAEFILRNPDPKANPRGYAAVQERLKKEKEKREASGDGDSDLIELPDAPAAIDPVARFLELFDQRYGPEKARNEAVTAYGQTRQNVMASLLNMQSLIGGGQ